MRRNFLTRFHKINVIIYKNSKIVIFPENPFFRTITVNCEGEKASQEDRNIAYSNFATLWQLKECF